MLCMILIFILMALDVVMFSVVPDYTTYGSQHYAVNITVGNKTFTEVYIRTDFDYLEKFRKLSAGCPVCWVGYD